MTDSIRITIGENIKEMREEHGHKKIVLATELGYSTANYGKIESGKSQLDCQGLITLCKFFECRPERIVIGKEPDSRVIIPDYFSNYSEEERRRIFRLFYILWNCQRMPVSSSFHRLFGSNLLNEIPTDESNAIPYVLEYERKSRDLTKREMMKFLGISKNKYYEFIGGEPLSDAGSLAKINQKLGYDMTFLLYNIVRPEVFLMELSPTWTEKEQNVFQKQLDLRLEMEELSVQLVEMQSNRR